MKTELQTKNVSRQLILGILVIGVGMLFLADNLGWWDFPKVLQFWPLIFIGLGVLKLVDSRRSEGYLVGAALVGIGVMMILHRLGVIYFNWRMVWPVLLIALGAATVYRAVGGRPVAGAALAASDATIAIFAILGGFERRIISPVFAGGEVTAIMGGCALDLRNSSIVGEAVINVFAVWGGVTLKVPPDWTVILQGTPIMGGFVEKTVAPADASKRLVVRGITVMGGLEVRN
ncbi:LiaF transmembrane domain-containing protein [Massilia sp. PWRC2]|uniref:LiaF transmembrane domain-containing protein n=1 Tax=Massilia sp. PWRC2 TaxID=2804626 RepID=UPI003CF7DD96